MIKPLVPMSQLLKNKEMKLVIIVELTEGGERTYSDAIRAIVNSLSLAVTTGREELKEGEWGYVLGKHIQEVGLWEVTQNPLANRANEEGK